MNYNIGIIKLTLLVLCAIIVIYYGSVYTFTLQHASRHLFPRPLQNDRDTRPNTEKYYVWLIFTKVTARSPLTHKFHNLLLNLLTVSSIPLDFNLIVDNSSKSIADVELTGLAKKTNKSISYTYYDIKDCIKKFPDIISVMTPRFSYKPGSYYSDALFYISLALYRIAPKEQSRAILLDCDLYFVKDIKLLFEEFKRFKPTALFGLAPELSPVYRHMLHVYSRTHNTTFGEYYRSSDIASKAAGRPHPRGFQGYNSGVILLKLDAVRSSGEYGRIIGNETVTRMTDRYKFRGHLGDQDFYTLVGYEYPHLIQTLNCGLNRQLCTWWNEHGYGGVFRFYFNCEHDVVVLHGNCNSRIPIPKR